MKILDLLTFANRKQSLKSKEKLKLGEVFLCLNIPLPQTKLRGDALVIEWSN